MVPHQTPLLSISLSRFLPASLRIYSSMEIFHFCEAGFCNPHLLAARIFKELLPTEWSPARSPSPPPRSIVRER